MTSSGSPDSLPPDLSFFLSDRRVEADGGRRRIVVEDRVLGFLRSRREIPFDRVDSLEYECEVREILGWISTYLKAFDRRDWFPRRGNPQSETYKVGVELRDPFEIVTLARFSGLGVSGSGVSRGGEIIIGGDPQSASRELLAHLEDVLDISLGLEASLVESLKESPYRCTRCDRPSPPNRKSCQYCGAAVMIGE